MEDREKNWERDCGLKRVLMVGSMKDSDGAKLKMMGDQGGEDVTGIYICGGCDLDRWYRTPGIGNLKESVQPSPSRLPHGTSAAVPRSQGQMNAPEDRKT